jgi:hypothetical protein
VLFVAATARALVAEEEARVSQRRSRVRKVVGIATIGVGMHTVDSQPFESHMHATN